MTSERIEFAYLIVGSRRKLKATKQIPIRICSSLEEAKIEAEKVPIWKFNDIWIEKIKIPEPPRKKE